MIKNIISDAVKSFQKFRFLKLIYRTNFVMRTFIRVLSALHVFRRLNSFSFLICKRREITRNKCILYSEYWCYYK